MVEFIREFSSEMILISLSLLSAVLATVCIFASRIATLKHKKKFFKSIDFDDFTIETDKPILDTDEQSISAVSSHDINQQNLEQNEKDFRGVSENIFMQDKDLAKALDKIQGPLGIQNQALSTSLSIKPFRWVEQLRSKSGWLVQNIPNIMRKGVQEEIEIRISDNDEASVKELMSGIVHQHRIQTSSTMSVRLYDPDSSFIVERLTPETQCVNDTLASSYGFRSSAKFGVWQWNVTPKKSGKHRLIISVSAFIGSTDIPLPPQDIEVLVKVNISKWLREAFKWLLLLLLGATIKNLYDEYWATLIEYFS